MPAPSAFARAITAPVPNRRDREPTALTPLTRPGDRGGSVPPLSQFSQERSHPPCGPQSPDEVILGIALITNWMLITGRRLDQQPVLHDLSPDQLIDFWADDHIDGPVIASSETGNA